MKKKLAIFFLIILVILVPFITISLLLNNTSINCGKIYYTCADLSYTNVYEYNVKTKVSRKITIDGYTNVISYIPINNGYIAIGLSENRELKPYDIIVNGEILINEDYVRNVTYKNGCLFYIRDDGYLVCINIKTRQYSEITDKIKYGYSFVDDFLYYCERDPDCPNNETNIFYIDTSRENVEKVFIDKGVINKNTDNELVYLKKGAIYVYDFAKQKPVKHENYEFEYDDYKCRYLGHLKCDSSNFIIHLKQFVIYNSVIYDDYYEYESELMRGIFLPSKQHIRLFSRIEIRDSKHRLLIPIKNADRVNIIAYKNSDEIIYVEQPCIYWIY